MDHIDAWIDNIIARNSPTQDQWVGMLRMSVPGIEYVDRLLSRKIINPQSVSSSDLVLSHGQIWSRFGSKALQSFLKAGRNPVFMKSSAHLYVVSTTTDLSAVLEADNVVAMKAIKRYLSDPTLPCCETKEGVWYPLAFACSQGNLSMVLEMCRIYPWKATPEQEQKSINRLLFSMFTKPIDQHCMDVIWDKISPSLSDATLKQAVVYLKEKGFDRNWHHFVQNRSLHALELPVLSRPLPSPSQNKPTYIASAQKRSAPSLVAGKTALEELSEKKVLDHFRDACSKGDIRELTNHVPLHQIVSFKTRNKSLLELSVPYPQIIPSLLKIVDSKETNEEGKNILFLFTQSCLFGYTRGARGLSKKKLEAFKSILKECDINHQDHLGDTVLMTLWKSSSFNYTADFLYVFDELFKKNPDFSIQNKEGKTLEMMFEESLRDPRMMEGTRTLITERLSTWVKKDMMKTLGVESDEPVFRRKKM